MGQGIGLRDSGMESRAVGTRDRPKRTYLFKDVYKGVIRRSPKNGSSSDPTFFKDLYKEIIRRSPKKGRFLRTYLKDSPKEIIRRNPRNGRFFKGPG